MLLTVYLRELVRDDAVMLHMVAGALQVAGIEPGEAPHMVAQVLTAPVENLTVSGDDARPHIAQGTVRADHLPELVRSDGITVELAFPKGWTTIRRKALAFS